MLQRASERGEIRFGTIVWLLLFVAGVIVTKEMVPVKIRTSQLEDYMIELAKFSTRETEDKLRVRIIEKADELELPLTKDAVSVRKANGRVKMKAQYEIPLEFPFYTYVWQFDHEVDRPIFII